MNWLRDHLIRGGHLTETGCARRAKLRPCPRCGERVIFGLDDVMCALEVRADPEPLSVLGEALALLEGRRTVVIHREGAGYVIDRRDDRAIATQPAGTGDREDVVRQHRCGSPPPPTAPSTFAPAALPPHPDNPPPF